MSRMLLEVGTLKCFWCEEHAVRHQKKDDPCSKLAENLFKLCSIVTRKLEPVSEESGYLAEEVSKQNVEDVAWFALDA